MSNLRTLNPSDRKEITVKILKTHDENIRHDVTKHHMILTDEHGFRIHAISTLQRGQKNNPQLIKGNWVKLRRFNVVWNLAFMDEDRLVKTTGHPYMIKFTNWTTVDSCQPCSDSLFNNFANLKSINDSSINIFCSVDLIGLAMNIQGIKRADYWKYGGVVDEIMFELQDHNGSTIKCILVKQQARDFNNFLLHSNGSPIVCLFRWFKISRYGLDYYAEAGGDYAEIFLNADVPEIQEFRMMYQAEDSFSTTNP